MAKKRELPPMTGEEIGELLRDIIKRIIIAGLVLVLAGVAIIVLMHLIYGGAQ